MIENKKQREKQRFLFLFRLDEFLSTRALNFVQNFFVKLLLVKKKVV
ncbi:MAG TPA: hypothetical protein VJJ52_02450 [Candidatus Nanoarchaeia archaeon]|nr:hypothetical protein [Candidatus Nanoarchaeia archaeon]